MTPRERVDCRAAFDRLYEYLDGELTPEREAEVREHLDRCLGCLRLTEFETAYLRFLDARAASVRAPEALKKRVLRQLLFSENEESREQA